MKKAGRKPHLLKPEERDPFMDMVIDLASDYLFVDKEDILCGASNSLYTTPRQIIMFIVKAMKPGLALKKIGQNLNINDHGTIVYGIKKMTDIVNRPTIDMVIHSKIMALKGAVENTIGGSESEYKKSIELDREAEMILNLSPMYYR